MEKWFSGREFVAARDANRRSGFVRTAIADSAIAASPAANRPGSISGVAPIADTNTARKDETIIVTGRASTGGAGHKRA